MNSRYQRYLPMLAVVSGAAIASVFAVFMVDRIRKSRCHVAGDTLEKWEGEGGPAAPDDTATNAPAAGK